MEVYLNIIIQGDVVEVTFSGDSIEYKEALHVLSYVRESLTQYGERIEFPSLVKPYPRVSLDWSERFHLQKLPSS